MRYIILTTLAAFAARCTAQGAGALATLDNLPSCAKPCADKLPTQCNFGVQCICADQAFIMGISCCISTACSPSDQQQTLKVAQQLCDTVNVQLPSAAGCSGSSSVASSATGASSATSATSAATGTASSAVSNASTSGTSATNSVGATAGTATGSTTSTTPSSSTTAKGAGERLGSNIGAVGAAVAALALL